MANNINKFAKYIDLLDEVYAEASLTSVLDGDPTLTSAGANANELIIPKMDMDGLANYDRNGGFVEGDVTLTSETVKFNYDRGRAFSVDSMDDEETAGVAFGRLSSEFIRSKTVPEMDAFRFSEYAQKAGATQSATFTDGEEVVAALRAATAQMDSAEVPFDERYLFISPEVYGLVQDLDETKSRAVLGRFAQIIMVPQGRFASAIELNDGSTEGQTQGGYSKAANGKDLNFMVIHKGAVLQYPKHTVSKVIRPEDNQKADAWKFFFRAYGLAAVLENHAEGIYAHMKA